MDGCGGVLCTIRIGRERTLVVGALGGATRWIASDHPGLLRLIREDGRTWTLVFVITIILWGTSL